VATIAAALAVTELRTTVGLGDDSPPTPVPDAKKGDAIEKRAKKQEEEQEVKKQAKREKEKGEMKDTEESPSRLPPPPPPPATSLEIVDRKLKELTWSSIAFNAPSEMRLGEAQEIDLLLSPAASVEELEQQITAEGETVSAEIRVSNHMQAQLNAGTGSDFTITPLTPEEQAVSSQDITEWEWAVEPTKPGSHTLELSIYARINIDGNATPTKIETFERTINVQVSLWKSTLLWVDDNKEWLLPIVIGSILIPLAGVLWRRKHQKNKTEAETRTSSVDSNSADLDTYHEEKPPADHSQKPRPEASPPKK
jgi:hypothetical protein